MWPWVVGIIGVVVVGIGIGAFLLVRLVSGPIDAANDFLAAWKDGDQPRANELVCTAERSDSILDSLTDRYGTPTSYNLNESSFTGGFGAVRGTVRTTRRVYSVTISMVKEDAAWKVCNVDSFF